MGIIKMMVAKNTKMLATAMLTLVMGSAALFQTPAYAEDERFFFGARPELSQILSANGFGTLLFALDTAELTDALDGTMVTLFAPTDDVFEDLAGALCYEDVLALATALIEAGLLDDVLAYHATPGKLNTQKVLLRGELAMLNGATVDTGVDSGGLYVQGAANATPSNITLEGILGRRAIVYPINQILLPPGTPNLSMCP